MNSILTEGAPKPEEIVQCSRHIVQSQQEVEDSDEYCNARNVVDDNDETDVSLEPNSCASSVGKIEITSTPVVHTIMDESYDQSSSKDHDNEDERSTDPQLENEAKESDVIIAEEKHKYGGLANLGNTCYLASALQLLASLDLFAASLCTQSCAVCAASPLCEELLQVFRKLRSGETVHPDDLKSILDSRSPLFLGFRQQDAHEFLTTLLDMLDDDLVKELSNDSSQNKHDNESQSGAVEEGIDEPSDSSGSIAYVAESVSSKKQRTEEPTQDVENCQKRASSMLCTPADEEPISSNCDALMVDDSMQSTRSYSELDVEAIGRLLHGVSQGSLLDAQNSSCSSNERHGSNAPQHKQCKLVGGRMSTTNDSLTAYEASPLQNGARVDAHNHNMLTSDIVSQNSTRMEVSDYDCEGDDNVDDEKECSRGGKNDDCSSPVDSVFATLTQVCLTCDSCKYSRSHTEKFLHLSLEIGVGCCNVDDAIRRFFAPCTLDLKCEKCFCETATQSKTITRLAPALLLHLKRFIVDVSPDYSSISYRKNQSCVNFDEALSLLDKEFGALREFIASDYETPQHLVDDTSYELRAVVNHIGSSASCGHYTCDTRRQGDESWVRFNDSHASDISQAEAVEHSSQTAYMVLYELLDGEASC